MKKFALLLLLLPMVCHAYEDHRGWNLDSLEREAAKWSWPRLSGTMPRPTAFWLTRKELTETSAVLDETIEELRPAGDAPAGKVHLTKREKDVARLLMEGQPTKQIAHSLGIGDETVLWYRKRLFAKLNVHSAAAFATEATKRGLL